MNAENYVFIDTVLVIYRQELYEENIVKICYHVFGRPKLYTLRKAVGFQFLLAMNARISETVT